MKKPNFNISFLLDYMKDENVSPDEIKEQIVEVLNPLFVNSNNLEKYAIEYLVTDWINYLKLMNTDIEYEENIKQIVTILNQDIQNSIDKTVEWFVEINKVTDYYWSFKNLEINKKDLDLYDFSTECLKNIGQVIEGLQKVFIKWYFHIFSNINGKNYTYDEVNKKDLGVILDYLIAKNQLLNILIISPQNIRLNQWRNIAYHHKSEVIDEKVICKYKNQGNEISFEINRDELFSVLEKTYSTYIIFKTAYSLFFFDNLDEIRSKNTENYNPRNHVFTYDLYSKINSQGFEVKEIITDKDNSTMILIDKVSNNFDIERAIHSSQFLYKLWILTKKETLTIEYWIKDKLFFVSSTNAIICIEAGKSGNIFKYLAEKVEFRLIE